MSMSVLRTHSGGELQPGAPAFPRRIALIVAAAFFMESLDGSIVSTALPSIARSFHQPTLSLTLGVSIYLLTLAVFVPTAGWFSNRFGARRVFATAVVVFTIASLLCGLSASPLFFFISRGIQGMAAAFMSPVGRLVVLKEAPKQYIIEAIALITWPGLIAPVVGPPLAGFLTTYASWRWIFLLNIPLGVIGTWLVLAIVPRYAAEKIERFDTAGFVFTAAALALLVQGLSVMSEGEARTWLGIALLLAGGLFGALSVRHARRVANPMLDLRAVTVPTYNISTVSAGLLSRTAISATPFLLPLMFQIGFGMNAFESGLMLLVYMLGNLIMKSTTTAVLRRFGFYRVLTVNGALCAAAIAACGLLSPDVPHALIYAVLLFAGMTRSMHFTSVNTLAFADVSAAQRAGASTLSSMLSQLASTLGVAFGAWALLASQHARQVTKLALVDFRHALIACGVVMAIGSAWSLRLPRDAGLEVTKL
jgi:EmrB/QacA subfamily drug resistance transporter